jgi:prenylcysteine oxidase / farnesylcysteine lyase
LQKFAARSEIPINITVFERSSYVGGRSTTVNAFDDPQFPVELGASIFVEVNEILKNSSHLFNLKPRKSDTDPETLGIWDGSKFVYTQKDSGWYWLDAAKLIWKYGLAPIRTHRLMKSTVGRFRQLYEHPYFPFRSLSAAVVDLDLVSVTSMTGEQFLSANSVSHLEFLTYNLTDSFADWHSVQY